MNEGMMEMHVSSWSFFSQLSPQNLRGCKFIITDWISPENLDTFLITIIFPLHFNVMWCGVDSSWPNFAPHLSSPEISGARRQGESPSSEHVSGFHCLWFNQPLKANECQSAFSPLLQKCFPSPPGDPGGVSWLSVRFMAVETLTPSQSDL